jgi:glycosyltransferase involved in cell wall biosynthesis
MDILAIPSTWYENSPLVLLNSLASHTPVIVAGVQGLTEFLDGGNGWSFSRGSVEELAALLQQLVAKPDETRAHSQRTFYDRTIEVMVDDVVDIYGRVLGKQRAAAPRAA